jgi:streptomycin 6-kinase
VQFNPEFISNVKETHKAQGQLWLNDLPEKITHICQKWGVTFLEVGRNLSYNFIGVVKIIATNEIAIIKISPLAEEIAKEYRWLQLFSPDIVPKVYQYDEIASAMLMEKIAPGQSLAPQVKQHDDVATRILCHAIRRLQKNAKPSHAFKSIATFKNDLELLQNHVSKPLLSKAISLFHDLSVDTRDDIVLHGDLHHYNILASGDDWKIIDPHAYTGDPAFEMGPMIFNPLYDFPIDTTVAKTIDRRIHILIEELPFDAERMKAWAFCRCFLAAAWMWESSHLVPEKLIHIATMIDSH